MKMLPFFIFIILIVSCSLKKNADEKMLPAIVDTIIPAMDTSIIPAKTYNPYSDSIYIKHQRDSFYAIKPAYLFTSTGNYTGFNKLIAAAIDTNAAVVSKLNFISDESYAYNKDSMPISKTVTYSNKNYKIRMTTKDLEAYQRKKIFINGRQLLWGTDIDTSLTGNNISYHIDLSPEDFKLIQFSGKEFLYLQGYVEKCNGKGCGVSYYLLYDPEIKKAIALQQYRIGYIYMGKCGTYNQLAFLVFDDYNQNYLYQYFTVAAKAYSFSTTGKIVPAKNAKGKQYYFDGYSMEDPDSISILKANFPLR